jgi:hypothetical protein
VLFKVSAFSAKDAYSQADIWRILRLDRHLSCSVLAREIREIHGHSIGQIANGGTMTSPKTETGAPTAKVMGGTIGAAVATLLIWGLAAAGLNIDETVKVALTTVITFVVGYMIPPAPRDNVVP